MLSYCLKSWSWSQCHFQSYIRSNYSRAIHTRSKHQFLFSIEFNVFQLEPYMDEGFVTNAFATMGESILQVKLIKNKITLYVLMQNVS